VPERVSWCRDDPRRADGVAVGDESRGGDWELVGVAVSGDDLKCIDRGGEPLETGDVVGVGACAAGVSTSGTSPSGTA
jgi:hypothetical protein